MVQTQFNTQVLKFMSNGGGEYQSKAFHNMLADQGIELLLLPPRTPQINGRAEHFMRTLTEKADAMRHTSGIPDSWWEFAVEHATHVYN
jgi:transposase InsO family protein